MFDAELYLRLIGELLIAEGPGRRGIPVAPELTAAAQALVAAGAIKEGAAQAVLDDYTLALTVRGGGHLDRFGGRGRVADATEPLVVGRVARCDAEFAHSGGTLRVRYVRLAPEVTEAAATVRFDGRGSPHHYGPNSARLTDDRGGSVLADFQGGGSETQWEGSFRADGGLAVDTAYLELDGTRLELTAAVMPSEVWLEPLAGDDPAMGHLWASLVPEEQMHREPPLEPAIRALVAAGALAADDPRLADVRAAAQALARYGGGSSRSLPEPWRSLARPRASGGPNGAIPVAAATPVFDGIALAVWALASHDAGWSVSVEIVPPMIGTPFERPMARPRRLAWWAADDRGHHYLGSMGSWSGGPHGVQGDVEFGSALDPRAAHLDLMPTAQTQRAVIRIPLDWASS